MREQASQPGKKWISWMAFSFLFAFLFLAIVLADSTAFALPLPSGNVRAIPAFARKYGLPCSACHTAWPELNNFGQVFRDNGYQLMNDRDSPIWQPHLLADNNADDAQLASGAHGPPAG